MVAHPDYPPGADAFLATVLSGTDLVGERCVKLQFEIFMACVLINSIHRKYLLLVGCHSCRHCNYAQISYVHSILVALNVADMILQVAVLLVS